MVSSATTMQEGLTYLLSREWQQRNL